MPVGLVAEVAAGAGDEGVVLGGGPSHRGGGAVGVLEDEGVLRPLSPAGGGQARNSNEQAGDQHHGQGEGRPPAAAEDLLEVATVHLYSPPRVVGRACGSRSVLSRTDYVT